MSRPSRPGIDFTTIIAVAAALGVVVVTQMLEGAPARSLWQPTAALIVFGGTLAAIFVSYPASLVKRTAVAVRDLFTTRVEPVQSVLDRMLRYAQTARRKGVIALEPELDRAPDPFVRAAIALMVDGANAKVARQILELESDARRERDEAPADVLDTAAGYAPTLGILGAVLGLIHVMQSLGEPSKLGSGIAVAFVATVYGVGSANLLLLPLATKLRGLARQAALNRELVIEGTAAMQDGMNPRLIEQKLQGFLLISRDIALDRRVA